MSDLLLPKIFVMEVVDMAGLEGPLGIVVICTLYKLLDGAKNKTLSALEHFVLDGQTD